MIRDRPCSCWSQKIKSHNRSLTSTRQLYTDYVGCPPFWWIAVITLTADTVIAMSIACGCQGAGDCKPLYVRVVARKAARILIDQRLYHLTAFNPSSVSIWWSGKSGSRWYPVFGRMILTYVRCREQIAETGQLRAIAAARRCSLAAIPDGQQYPQREILDRMMVIWRQRIDLV